MDDLTAILRSSGLNQRCDLIDEIECNLQDDPDLWFAIFWDIVTDYIENDAFFAEFWCILYDVTPERLESSCVDGWQGFAEAMRRNVAMASGTGAGRDQMYWSLFSNPVNTVKVRHLMAAGCWSSRHVRDRQMIRRMVDGIGRYEDTESQERLEMFIQNCRRA